MANASSAKAVPRACRSRPASERDPAARSTAASTERVLIRSDTDYNVTVDRLRQINAPPGGCRRRTAGWRDGYCRRSGPLRHLDVVAILSALGLVAGVVGHPVSVGLL